MDAFRWCIVLTLAFVIASMLLPWERHGSTRLVLAVLAAVTLVIGVLIGTGIIATG